MRVLHERLSPRVQHGDEADLGAEMAWIRGNGAEGLRGGAKEDAVDHRLILRGDLGDGLGYGEDCRFSKRRDPVLKNFSKPFPLVG